MRPPSTLEQAARALEEQRIDEAMTAEREADDSTDHAQSAVAQVLTGRGAKPRARRAERNGAKSRRPDRAGQAAPGKSARARPLNMETRERSPEVQSAQPSGQQIVPAASRGLALRSAALVGRGLRDMARDSNWLIKKVFPGFTPRLAISAMGTLSLIAPPAPRLVLPPIHFIQAPPVTGLCNKTRVFDQEIRTYVKFPTEE